MTNRRIADEAQALANTGLGLVLAAPAVAAVGATSASAWTLLGIGGMWMALAHLLLRLVEPPAPLS